MMEGQLEGTGAGSRRPALQGLLGYRQESMSYAKSNVKALSWHDLIYGLKNHSRLFSGERKQRPQLESY